MPSTCAAARGSQRWRGCSWWSQRQRCTDDRDDESLLSDGELRVFSPENNADAGEKARVSVNSDRRVLNPKIWNVNGGSPRQKQAGKLGAIGQRAQVSIGLGLGLSLFSWWSPRLGTRRFTRALVVLSREGLGRIGR